MSTWNMPPGVTTNDIPGNRGDEEELEAAYIKECGELGIETIIGTWLDGSHLYNDAEFKEGLRKLLRSQDELEIAQIAARCVGNPDFEEWVEEER